MSRYTTELRFICEQQAGYDKQQGYNNVKNVLEKAYPKVFDFDYPIFDTLYKPVLEKKILRHYYTREICEETYGLWKLRLEDKMNNIMPYYNQLYESELLQFNPFYDTDFTEKQHTKANENKVGSDDNKLFYTNAFNSTNTTDETTKNITENAQNTNVGEHFKRDFGVIDNTNSGTQTMTDFNGNVKLSDKDVTVTDRDEKLKEKLSNSDKVTTNKTDVLKEINSGNDVTNTIITEDLSETNGGSDTFNKGTLNEKSVSSTAISKEKDSQSYNEINRYSDTPQSVINMGVVEQDGYLTNVTINDKTQKTDKDGNSSSIVSEQSKDGGKDVTDYGKTTQNLNEKSENKTLTHGHIIDNNNKYDTIELTEYGKQTDNTNAIDVTETTTYGKRETTHNTTGFNEDYTKNNTRDEDETTNKNTATSDLFNGVFTGKNGVFYTGQDFTKHDSKELKLNRQAIDNTNDYINIVVGKRGTQSYSSLLTEFRETFLNIDAMILEELADLFMLIY